MKAGGGHVAFAAPTRAAVHEFFASAVEAGARPHGKPAQRHDGDSCFNAGVLDFDGNSVECVYHEHEHKGAAAAPVAEDTRVISWRDSVADAQSVTGRSVKAPSVI